MSCDECPPQMDGFIILLLITVFSMRSANKFGRLLCFIGKKQTKAFGGEERSFDTWSSAKETQTGSQITTKSVFLEGFTGWGRGGNGDQYIKRAKLRDPNQRCLG